MADERTTPLSEEHLEADQYYLDKARYEMVSKMSEEEQAAFKKMEQAVELLVGTKRPFYLVAAPSESDHTFWRYQKYSQEKVPVSDEEWRKILYRAWYAMHAHASHFAELTGNKVVFIGRDDKPYHMFTPDGEVDLRNKNE